VDIGAVGRKGGGFPEERNSRVIVVNPEGIECFCQRFVRGIVLFLSQRGGGNQAERG
jgi:hypothetical protein